MSDDARVTASGVEVGAIFSGRQKFVRITLAPVEAEGLADLLAQNGSDRGFRDLSERLYSVLEVITKEARS